MPTKKAAISFLCNFFIPLAGISTDIYLPSLPAISHLFHVSKELVQITVTSFAIGMGLVQLIAGPISDAIGRHKLMFTAILLQLTMIILILFTPSITWMIIFRFFQGCGAALLIVPSRAILSDTFEGDALKKQYNYATIAFALGPILGPFIGGYLENYFGWQANFIFILCYALIVLLLLIFVYRETIAQKRAFHISHIWHNTVTITSNRVFLYSCLFTACLFSGTGFFNVAGPFLIQVSMGYSPIVFGHMALTIGCAWFLGNLTNRFLFRVNQTKKTLLALAIFIISSLVMLISSLLGYFTLTVLMMPIFMIIYVSGATFSMYTAECLSLFKDLAASANGIFFSSTWIGFAVFTGVATLLKSSTLTPMAISLLVMSIVCSFIYIWVYRAHQVVKST